MSHEQMTVIENDPINPIIAMGEETITVRRDLHVLVMHPRFLMDLLDAGDVRVALEVSGVLPTDGLTDPETTVGVVTTMETPPKDPPQENEGVAGGRVLGVMNLGTEGYAYVCAVSDTELTRLRDAQLCIQEFLTSEELARTQPLPVDAGLTSATPENVEQRFVSSLELGGLVRSDQRLEGGGWTVNRSSGWLQPSA
jgi:hypothetical protein